MHFLIGNLSQANLFAILVGTLPLILNFRFRNGFQANHFKVTSLDRRNDCQAVAEAEIFGFVLLKDYRGLHAVRCHLYRQSAQKHPEASVKIETISQRRK